MQNRKALFTFFLVNNRSRKAGYGLPKPVLTHYFVKPTVETLLDYVAYGDLENVKKILTDNPGLLRFRGDTKDPAGNTIKLVSAYELALGAGDDEMAAIIRECFDKFPGGEEVRIEQEKNYKDAIDNMLKQPAFDFSELMQVILDAPQEEVTEELKSGDDFNADYQGNIHPQYKKTLRQALDEFRKYFAPREIKNGEMHFNYTNLQKAFDVYADQFDALKEASNNNWDKRDLFSRQVIGFIQRRLPACDRQAFAQGIYYIVEDKEKLQRKFDFRFGGGSFPITSSDLSRSGLGFDLAGGLPGLIGRLPGGRGGCVGKLMSSKSIRLAKLMQSHQQEQSRCVIC